jgi:hypothetical protein
MNKHLSGVRAAGRNNNILWSGGDSKTIFDQLKASARQNTKQNHRAKALFAPMLLLRWRAVPRQQCAS